MSAIKIFRYLSQLLDVAVTRSAPVWPRFNADGTVSQLDAAATRAALGAGTGSGTVTAVSIASANGFSGSSSGGATPALTIVAGDITPNSVTASTTLAVTQAGVATTISSGSVIIGAGVGQSGALSVGTGNPSGYLYTIYGDDGSASTANRDLYINLNDGNRDLNLGGSLYLESTFRTSGDTFVTNGVTYTLPGTTATLLYAGGALGTPASGVATNLTGTASGLTAGLVTSIGNLTGDITSSNRATTLATVNSNVGTFGSATAVAQITLDAKGRATAASNVTITPAIGSITGLASADLTVNSLTGTNYLLSGFIQAGGASAGVLKISNGGVGQFGVQIVTGGTYSADRNLTVDLGNATRTLALSGDLTIGSAFTTSGNNLTTNGFTYTLPGATSSLARKDAAQTFTGVQSMTSPDVTTSITTPSTTFAIANTTATTVNAFGAATTLNMLASGGTLALGGGTVTLTGAASLTGGAGNMTITSGTGNSRTLTIQTTTSGGTATNAITIGATQVVTFPANVSSSSTLTGTVVITGGLGVSSTIYCAGVNALGGVAVRAQYLQCYTGSGSSGATYFECPSGTTVMKLRTAGGVDGDLTLANLTASGDVVCATAGKGLQLKSGTGARGGNATLVAGTVTVTNTTTTANTLVLHARKTIGGVAGNLTYTLSAGASFTINSDNIADTSVVTYHLIELN